MAGREVWGGRQRWGVTPQPLPLRDLALGLSAHCPCVLLTSSVSRKWVQNTAKKRHPNFSEARPSVYESDSNNSALLTLSGTVLRALCLYQPLLHHHGP